MPRNGAGTFGVINPILVGALRSSSAVNQNFTDMGDEITNSLPVSGVAAMTGQFAVGDGDLVLPGLSFAQDLNTGFRRSAIDEVRWVGGGVDRATMDANGKLTLAGGISVAGAFTHATTLGRQTLAGLGAARAVLRNTSNDTDEHELVSYRAGDGSGAKGSLRMVGGGANDVQTMRYYVNDVLSFQWTSALFTHSVDTLFGASGVKAFVDGFFDFTNITVTAPAVNVARVYSNGGPVFKGSDGVEKRFQPEVDHQVFTGSSTWAKPTAGQTMARVEMWAGGGSGGVDSDGAGGGGGGAYAVKVIALASLSASVSVTVGSGGAGRSSFGPGAGGGNSSFGSYLTAYGGGGGGQDDDNNGSDGGSGGGLTSAGVDGGFDAVGGRDGGGPNGLLGSELWGDNSNGGTARANAFGGGGSTANGGTGGAAWWGGGGGGGSSDSGGSFGSGGSSVFGGGGAAGSAGPSAGGSVFGGAGGLSGVSGSIPGGAGGGIGTGTSGSGARGEVRITCW